MTWAGNTFPDCPCENCRRVRGELPPRPRPAVPAPHNPFDLGPAGDEEDDWDDEDDALEGGFGDLPPGAVKALIEMLEGYIGATGKLPTPEEIRRKDPELYREIMAMMEGYAQSPAGAGLPFGDEAGPYFDDFLPPRQNTKTRRKKRGKHKK